jgi:hypothetical protein
MIGKSKWHWFGLLLASLFLLAVTTTMAGSIPSFPSRGVVVPELAAQHAGLVAAPAAQLPPPKESTDSTGEASTHAPSTGAAPAGSAVSPFGVGSIMSISGSTVTTEDCYEAGSTQTLCFTVYNGSTDAEWLDQVRLTFPNYPGLGPWTVSCKTQDATDSSGNPVHFACSASSNEVTYTDDEVETPVNIGEVTAGSTWGFCVDVTIPGGYNGPRYVQWGLSGDEDPWSSPPHDVYGSTLIEMCTPLMLKPSSQVASGCNGISQTHTFELWNYAAGNGTFTLSYTVSSGNGTFGGPSSFYLQNGEVVTFTTWLTPDLCLASGDQVAATLQAQGNGHSDSSTLVKTISAFEGWEQQAPSPISTMDNAVVWAVEDGGLWSIGGYGSNGATQRYDPQTNTWTTHTVEMSPTIEYPMDGCYGLNGDGDEIVVLFPDTLLTGTLHIYNITDDDWYTETVPAFYPAEGRWGQDITSLYNVTGQNVCYLTGGSTREGGGRTRDLWVYDPASKSGSYLGNFPLSTPFNFHASWYVPWVGASGAICVGGGVDFNSNAISDTQCYDLAASSFNTPNADLGPLPEPWWGMADGWKYHKGRYQIWIANGVKKNGALIGASAYADHTTGGFQYGPTPAVKLYRLEGDGWMGHFYSEQGAAGGFNHTYNDELLVQCPACIEWDKWINNEKWYAEMSVTAETSDTIQITDVFTTDHLFDLRETWDSDELNLLDWSVDPAFLYTVVQDPTGVLTWYVRDDHPMAITMTKYFHVKPSTWLSSTLTEGLLINDELFEQKPFAVEKQAPQLWINALYDSGVFTGTSAFFTLEYGNTGGYENNVTITNTFPITVPFVWSSPMPDTQDPGGLWARWDVGDLANGDDAAIVVEVEIDTGLVPSTTISIWDGIFNHVGELRDETIVEFHVEQASAFIWEKWLNDMPWHPGITMTVETSGTVVVVDVIETSREFVLAENWDIDLIMLQGYQVTAGTVTETVGGLEWGVLPSGPQVATMTKTFQVKPCNWIDTDLWEELRVDGVDPEQRPVTVVKDQPALWIESLYEPGVQAGGLVTFSVEYGNAGGYESSAWVFGVFWPEAPFAGSDPWPDEVAPDNLSARWNVGDLARGQQDSIAVTVAVTETLPPSSTVGALAAIFNHVDVVQGETLVWLHVEPPPPPEWEKRVNGQIWDPDLVVTAETSGTVEVVDVFVGDQAFNLFEAWDPAELALTGWTVEPTFGTLTVGDASLEWVVPPAGAVQALTLTKQFRVEPCTWEAAMLYEALSVGEEIVEERPVFIVKQPPVLWIESLYEPEIHAGHEATFTLGYGNGGGYENDTWIVNEFPPMAPFLRAVPWPDEVAPDSLWARWDVGNLAKNDEAMILVTVSITETLPPSSTVGIWDGIFSHVGELRDETFINFVIPGYPVYLPLVLRNYSG